MLGTKPMLAHAVLSVVVLFAGVCTGFHHGTRNPLHLRGAGVWAAAMMLPTVLGLLELEQSSVTSTSGGTGDEKWVDPRYRPPPPEVHHVAPRPPAPPPTFGQIQCNKLGQRPVGNEMVHTSTWQLIESICLNPWTIRHQCIATASVVADIAQGDIDSIMTYCQLPEWECQNDMEVIPPRTIATRTAKCVRRQQATDAVRANNQARTCSNPVRYGSPAYYGHGGGTSNIHLSASAYTSGARQRLVKVKSLFFEIITAGAKNWIDVGTKFDVDINSFIYTLTSAAIYVKFCMLLGGGFNGPLHITGAGEFLGSHKRDLAEIENFRNSSLVVDDDFGKFAENEIGKQPLLPRETADDTENMGSK